MSTQPLPYYIANPNDPNAPPVPQLVSPMPQKLTVPPELAARLSGQQPQLQSPQATQTPKLVSPPVPKLASPQPPKLVSPSAQPQSGTSDDGGPTIPLQSAPNPFTLSSRTPTQAEDDLGQLNYLKSSGSGISQIKNPFLRTLARVGDITGDVVGAFNPLARVAMANIPGTTMHHNQLLGQQNAIVNNDNAQAENQAKIDDQNSQIAERQALAGKYGTQADSMKPFTVTPEMAQAAGVPELSGQTVSQATYQKLFGGTQRTQANEDIASGHDATKVETTGMNNDTSRSNNENTNSTRESISTAADKTRMLLGQMHDATSRANNQNTNNHKGVNADGSYKVPADVTKRAALGGNVIENANAVDGVITRRPDIVGLLGGRATTVQQMIGSDDPDIAELGVRMHNIALASNGAHGVRSQQAIQQTEDELLNHFKNGPTAIHSALNATRGSMQTFLNDEQNFEHSGQRTPQTPQNSAESNGKTGPKEGDTKINSSGDKIAFKGGKWVPS